MLKYRRVCIEEKDALVNLMNAVVDGLDRKDFFTPFTTEEINAMFDDNVAITYGAFDEGKIVGTAQLYLGDTFVDEIKRNLGIEGKKAAEFGGVMVLKEYRNMGIMKHFAEILTREAQKQGYEYVVACTHVENQASNAAITNMGVQLKKAGNLSRLGNRNMYLISLD